MCLSNFMLFFFMIVTVNKMNYRYMNFNQFINVFKIH